MSEKFAASITPRNISGFRARIKVMPSGCHEWQAGINNFGRGLFWCAGKTRLASRIAWVLANGDIPKGLFVLHRCDNGLCCNPDHLFLGTQADNVHDCVSKGRAHGAHQGVEHHNAKLNPSKVREIRRLCEHNTQEDVAKRYGVTRSCIEQIVCGVTWKSVK